MHRKEIQSRKLVIRKEATECLSGLLISKLMTIKKHNRISLFFLMNIALLSETQEHLQIMSESVLHVISCLLLRNYYVIGNKQFEINKHL